MSLAETTLNALPVVQAFAGERPEDARFTAAADRTRRARNRLATARTQLAAAEEGLRQAVVAEHAASPTSAWALSVHAGVTVRRWLAADGAGADGPTDSSPS